MTPKQIDINSSLADYKEHIARKQPMGNTKSGEHLAQKRTKIDKAIANAQAFQKQRTALINMSTQDQVGAALEAGIIGAATGGGIIAAQKGIKGVQKVANAYKEAKSTVKVNNVLIHGGAGVLEGGVINPKFVQGNTVELNQQALSRTDNVINQYQKNVNFTKEQVAIPGSYAYNNKSKSLAQIAQGEKAIADTKKWVEIAKRDNYFSAVDDANSAYGFKGAYHVVKPPKQNVSVQFGPSGEYQVAGSQKPVKSFSTVGKTASEQSDIAKKVNAYADRLRQQQIKKEAIKQALKNIRK